MDPQDIIRILGMQPHPEGGWYKETFRDPAGGGRGHSTAIYYLLQAGERSTGTGYAMPPRSGTTTLATRCACGYPLMASSWTR